MKVKLILFVGILALAAAVFAADPPKNANSNSSADPAATSSNSASAERNSEDADTMRAEGEKRFRANCSRCHAAPHKFPPRMMATIVRHMRVRATITDADMRYILAYMTQ
jgi:mono/diheme cytochrome c family protein